jgi:predicted nuclease with TOPRIM domain
MGRERKKNLEDLRADNAHLWEENEHLKDGVQLFKNRMEDMEKHLETDAKMLSFINKKFEEH